MTPENFCYWLQGFFEILDADGTKKVSLLSLKQIEMIKQHLDYVFSTPQEATDTVVKELLTEEGKKELEGFEKSLKKFRPSHFWGSDTKIC